MKNTTRTFKQMKQKGEKISMLTCYDYSTAKIMEDAGINGILVGDSLGNVMQSYENTLPVTMEETIMYGRSVARATKDTMVVMDMPFMSYQVSIEQALTNAGRLMKEANGNAVKLEGGAAVCPQIKAMTEVGIPVMAHLGLTPQSINALGGNRVQGKSQDAAKAILDDALRIQEAGAFAVVLECVPAPLAALITKKLDIPTIGIGAGNQTDGQILVYQDMLGMFSDYVPKFVKTFANLGQQMKDAFSSYDQEVKSTAFPDANHEFHKMENEEAFDALEELDRLY